MPGSSQRDSFQRWSLRAAFPALWLFLFLGVGAQVSAQDGADDERISLPEGPGSLEGVGENVSVNTNMGLMSYGVGISVPEGRAGMTPGVSLSYSSGGGASVVGVGWNLPVSAIERMTTRGLPEYQTDDIFQGPGGQLVEVYTGSDGATVYRPRFEGSFTRYQWRARGDGSGGYWIAEMADGKIGYFGADRHGNPVDSARIGGDEGVFKYLLVDTVDRFGHHIHHTYRRFGGTSLLSSIAYAFDEEGRPRFSVAFDYEDRPDFITDAGGGFVESTEHRLAGIRTLSNGVQLQSWALSYEEDESAGGLSRLTRVERFGYRGTKHPVVFDFEYSRALGAACQGQGCDMPFVVDMGNLGVNFQSGNASIVDLNGDSLPDVVNTTGTGAHQIFLSDYRAVRDHTFTRIEDSATGTGSTHPLGRNVSQVLDVNGDGFADLLNTRTGQVLENLGQGDWTRSYNFFEGPNNLPSFEGDLDPDDGGLESIRFMDADGDKRIDVLRSQGAGPGNQTQIYRNTGAGFEILEGVNPIGIGFESERLQLADMNGDGLLDPVMLSPNSLRYRVNLGYGKWTDWVVVDGLPFGETVIERVVLDDLNNDGLSDLVLVIGDEVRYALSMNGTSFNDVVTVTHDMVDGEIPTRYDTTTVMIADMNGNGTQDVVWIDENGNASYMELFARQPNLLSKITNNLGMVQEVTYRTSIEEAAEDRANGVVWANQLPYPSTLVKKLDAYDLHSNVHNVTLYHYRDGFYDGIEKQFRGFAMVETETKGDENNEDGVNQTTFDVGITDPYRAGLQLEQRLISNNRVIRELFFEYEECPLGGIPENAELSFPIKFVCQTNTDIRLVEGAIESEQIHSRTERTYDGYGNIVLDVHLGTVASDRTSCEPCARSEEVFGMPCGEQCLGDESYIETEYISPEENNDIWILGQMKRERRYGRIGGDASEKRIYYDGPAFEGLPLGQLTHGVVTRVENRVSDEEFVESLRVRVDEHGNMVEALRPNGSPEVETDHRSRQEFDEMGLRVRAMEVLLTSKSGEPYIMRQEARYDELWLRVATATEWMTVRNGEITSPPNTESVTYDEFGRLVERYYPEDPDDAPSERISYDLQSPRSRVIVERRSERGGEFDIRTIRCFDGRGRKYQERVRLDGNNYLVAGFVERNQTGGIRRSYDKFTGTGDACDAAPPEGVAHQEFTYDATGRPLTDSWVSVDGQKWTRRNEYGPEYVLNYSFNDNNPDSPHFDTPTRYDFDGRGRKVRYTRLLDPVTPESWEITYDDRGNYRGYIDPQGNEKIQEYDLGDRLVRITDPDRGIVHYKHASTGKVIEETDARGVTHEYEYDSMGRLVRLWDRANPVDSLIEYQYDFPVDCPASMCTNTANQMVEVSHAHGSDWFGYSSGGKNIWNRRTLWGRTFDFAWAYDNVDRMTTRSYPDGRQIHLEQDMASRLTAIPGIVERVEYDDTARVSGVEMSNGVVERTTRDEVFRISSRTVETDGGELLLGHTYSFDRDGNLQTLRETGTRESGPSADADFSYDAFDRLMTAHLDPGQGGEHEEVLSIDYDSIGNILSKTSSIGPESGGHVGTYSYGFKAPHALTAAGDLRFEYDNGGMMTQRGDMTLGWDNQGRMTSVERDGEEILKNHYGAGFNRLRKDTREGKVWFVAPDYEIRNGIASIYMEAGDHNIARMDSTSMATAVLSDLAPVSLDGAQAASNPDGVINAGDAWVSARYTLDEAQSTPTELLNAAVARLLTQEEDTLWLHADHQESTVAVTNAQGEVIERTTRYPHGEVRGEKNNVEIRGYNSKEEDDETGLIYFGARFLDQHTGRWISPDPHFEQHENPGFQKVEEETGAYVAMNNNPVRFHDPDGRIVIEGIELTIRGIGALAGAVTGAIDWVRDTRREAEVMGSRATKRQMVGWGAVGAIVGAGYGFLNPTTSAAANILDLGLSFAVDKLVLSRVFKGQNLLTARRITRSITTAAVSIGVTLGVAALLATPAAPLVIAGAALFALAKISYYAYKHRKAVKAERANQEQFQQELGGVKRSRGGAVGRKPFNAQDGLASGGATAEITAEYGHAGTEVLSAAKAGIPLKVPGLKNTQPRPNAAKRNPSTAPK